MLQNPALKLMMHQLQILNTAFLLVTGKAKYSYILECNLTSASGDFLKGKKPVHDSYPVLSFNHL
jgi:hypothetical protein